MWGTISPGECSALYRLVATSATDLVIRTDPHGRIVHASPAAGWLGLAFAGGPAGRHLLELVDPAYSEMIIAEHRAALTGASASGWIEMLAQAFDGEPHWMEVRFGGLAGAEGVIAIMRSIEDRRALENRLFVAAMTDPLTSLANRTAFGRMLAHLVESGAAGHLALFDLDHFRTINLTHGHSGGDRVLVAFARLLRSLLREEAILARLGGGTFGVLLPDAPAGRAEADCARIVAAMAEMNASAPAGHTVGVSAGIAPFAASADASLHAAELALISAKARGRGRVERSRPAASGRARAA